MRNRKTPASTSSTTWSRHSWAAPDSQSTLPQNLNLSSEIENLFNTYTQQNNTSMGNANPLLDDELQSDVTFLVGIEPEIWRIPGHKRILADKNSVFQAMFFGAMAHQESQNSSGVIYITDVPGRAFDYFIKFLYNDDIEFLNVSSTLDILHVSNKYLCTQLIKKCVFYLDQNLTPDNVLDIYSNIQLYVESASHQRNEFHFCVPSAPTFDDLCDSHISHQQTEEKRMKAQYKDILDIMQPSNDAPESITRILNLLCYNCLLFIDIHAEQIFSSLQNIENISNLQILHQIFTRSSLQINDELLLYKFLNELITNNLKQLQIPISLTNKRKYLNEHCADHDSRLLFSIKYFLVDNFETFMNQIQTNENNCLFYDYEIDFLSYLKRNQSSIHTIVKNLDNMPRNNIRKEENGEKQANISDRLRMNPSQANISDRLRMNPSEANISDGLRMNSSSTIKSWEHFNLNYIDVLYMTTRRTPLTDLYLPLSLRSLPKITPQNDIKTQEKVRACKNKEKKKFAEYVWTVLFFIFD